MIPAPRSSGGLLNDLLKDLAHVVSRGLELLPRFWIDCTDIRYTQTTRKRPLRLFSSAIPVNPPLLPATRRSPFPSPSSHSTSPRSIRTSRLLPLLRASSPTARSFLSSSSSSAPPSRIESLEELFKFRQHLSEAPPSEIVQAWESRSKLWESTSAEETTKAEENKLLIEDEQSWKVYLKALANQVGSTEGETLTQGLKKLTEAESKRNQLLEKMGWKSSVYPEPSTTSDSTPPATANPTLSKLSPSGLISALFSSSSSRGKGGEAKIKSTGSFGSWLNNGNNGNSGSGTASEPIRVVVEEAKSPLVWRIVKFVAVTALYSFLLCVFIRISPTHIHTSTDILPISQIIAFIVIDRFLWHPSRDSTTDSLRCSSRSQSFRSFRTRHHLQRCSRSRGGETRALRNCRIPQGSQEV